MQLDCIYPRSTRAVYSVSESLPAQQAGVVGLDWFPLFSCWGISSTCT